MSVYLDNASTQYIAGEKDNKWFNPNAKYAHEVNKLLQDNYKKMKELLGVSSGMIAFGGQNASQLIDLLYGRFKKFYPTQYWSCSPFEHNIIANKSNGENGYMYWQMYVNNLTGEVHPVNEIGKKYRANGELFGCDMTSAIGHIELPKDLEQWCDCIVMSGHKFGGGYMGCMWLSDRLCKELDIIEPSDLASGTPNAKGIDEFVSAFELANKDIDKKERHCLDLICSLVDGLFTSNIGSHFVIVNLGKYVKSINAIRLVGINADALQQYLASKNIYIGRGASSCDSNNDDFRVLQAYGLTKQEASEVVRISFNEWNTVEEVEELVKAICEFKEKFL